MIARSQIIPQDEASEEFRENLTRDWMDRVKIGKTKPVMDSFFDSEEGWLGGASGRFAISIRSSEGGLDGLAQLILRVRAGSDKDITDEPALIDNDGLRDGVGVVLVAHL